MAVEVVVVLTVVIRITQEGQVLVVGQVVVVVAVTIKQAVMFLWLDKVTEAVRLEDPLPIKTQAVVVVVLTQLEEMREPMTAAKVVVV
jgi:hypothetical protein